MSKIKMWGIGQKKKDGKEKEENIDTKISKEIEDLNKNIMKSMTVLRSSIDALIPDCKSKLYYLQHSYVRNNAEHSHIKLCFCFSSGRRKSNTVYC